MAQANSLPGLNTLRKSSWSLCLTALICVTSLAPALAAAAATDMPSVTNDPLSGLVLRTVLGLCAVLVMIFALAWVAKRWGQLLQPSSPVPMRVIAQLALTPRERLVIVEIDDIWLIVGITAGGMRTLHSMPAQPLTAATPTAAASFLSRFQQARQSREP